ncbi:MAG: site-specific integrase [Planctomycetes bacterium]|nr:site-specific integrase [Planctomycetota bacterium]
MIKPPPTRRNRGATLQWQGQQWIICFRDPRKRDPKTGYAKPVRKSLKTADGDLAQRYKRALDRIIEEPSYWMHPPKETPSRVCEIWLGSLLEVEVNSRHLPEPVRVEPIPDQAKETIQPEFLEILKKAVPPPPYVLFGGDPHDQPEREAYAQRVARLVRNDYPDDQKLEALAVAYDRVLQELHAERTTSETQATRIKELEAEKEALERQNQVLNHRLGRYEAKELRHAQAGTLRQEFDRYVKHLDTLNTSRAWKRDVKGYLERFLKDVDEDKPANEFNESALGAYVGGLKSTEGNRISEGMRKRARGQICRFLEFATHGSFRRGRVATVKEKALRREAKEIIWLEKDEVAELIRHIPEDAVHGLYWRDLAQIQVAMGWRPSELLLLQTKLATIKIVALEPLTDPVSGEIRSKTGGRAVSVPKAAQAAVQRRIEAGHELLFPKLTGTNRRKRGGLLEDAWAEAMFFKDYRKVLRAAAAKAEIKKPLDSRTLRRTFGSLQLRAGRKPHEVAELMGDRVETVRRHYARLLAHEIDTEV